MMAAGVTAGGMALDCLPVGAMETNCWLLADPAAGEAVVIDPGGDARRILEQVARRGWKVTAVLLTHGHFDHAGAAAEVVKGTGAPFLVPRGDERQLAGAVAEAARFGVRVSAPPPPTRLLKDGETLAVGSFRLKVIFTPGHTPGSAVFFTPAGVFAGDLLFAGSVGRTDLPGGDMGALLRSIRERILTLTDATPVYPGHGPSTTVGRERAGNPFLAP
jgi:hydroxyacylglutathione hydrolase